MKQHGLSDDAERIVLQRFHGGVETCEPTHEPTHGPTHEPEGSGPIHRFLFVDVESTGLQPGIDRLIEFAAAGVDVQVASGRIVAHHGTTTWLEDPGCPIPAEITQLTGIRDEDVAGQKIPEDEVRALFADASVVVAHNARFDRSMSMARFAWLKDESMPPWACSLHQIDWKGYGHRHANLGNLAMDHGFFYQGHRATIDVEALIKLLTFSPDDGSAPYLCDLIADVRQPYFLLAASGTPFEAKDELKARGFRWDAEQKHWFTSLPEPQLECELAWVEELCVRHGRGRAIRARIPFSQRFADDHEPAWQAS
jgi:DNA polymerase-3 subunit epsilon